MGGRFSKPRKAAAIEMSEPVDLHVSHPTEVFEAGWITATLSMNEGEISAYDKQKKLVTINLSRCSILSVKKDKEHSELFLIMDEYQIKIRTKNKEQFKLWLSSVSESISPMIEPQKGIELQDLTTEKEPPSPSAFNFPILNIAILVVGTRGDIQPFIYFAQRLQQDGHRVRLATHTEYRPDVMKAGLEYYPLGGDPRKLSEFMVKSEGKLLPTYQTVFDIPEKKKMVREITFSCYPACTEPDPEDPHKRPFYADAIISNPVTYGHIHCAQAMNIPLHIMFPQPWSPTKSFPHPLSNMGFKKKWSRRNHSSFVYVDGLMWVGLGAIINDFRMSMNLNPMGHTDYPGNSLLNAWKVPISHMYSPAFVPKCRDWPAHVDVVGEFRNSSSSSASKSSQFTPPQQLLDFFNTSSAAPPSKAVKYTRPFYIGFGSMVIKDPKRLVTIVMEAARIAGVRVIMQNGWTKLGEELQKLSENVMVVGPMPHDYLFEQVCGVVHHGGAGTTSAGLRAGNPTFICPFFGDQHFWAEMVFRSGVGPKGCAVQKLTIEKLVDAFKLMRSEATVQAVRALSKKMSAEDGVEAARRSFYRQLPTQHMLCDVSRYGYEPKRYKLASVYCYNCGLKLCQEADFLLHLPGSYRTDHVRIAYVSKIWDATVNTTALHNNKISSTTNSGLDDELATDIDLATRLAVEELAVRDQVENRKSGGSGSPQKSPAQAFLASQSPSPTRQTAPNASVGPALQKPTPSPSIANSSVETNPFNFMKNSAVTFDRTMLLRMEKELSSPVPRTPGKSYFTSEIVDIEYAYYKCKQFLWTQAMITFSNSLDMPAIQGSGGKVELTKAEEDALLFHIESLGYNVNVSPAERKELIRAFISSAEASTLSFETKNVISENQASTDIHTTVAGRMLADGNDKKGAKPDLLMDAVFGYADSPVSPLYTEAPSSFSSGFSEGMSNLLTGATGASAIALYVPMKCTVSGYKKFGAAGAVGGFLGGVCIGPLMATSYMLYGTGIGLRQMGRGLLSTRPDEEPDTGDATGKTLTVVKTDAGKTKGSASSVAPTNELDSDEDEDDDDDSDLGDEATEEDLVSDSTQQGTSIPDSGRRSQFVFEEPPSMNTDSKETKLDAESKNEEWEDYSHLLIVDPLRRKSVLEDYL